MGTQLKLKLGKKEFYLKLRRFFYLHIVKLYVWTEQHMKIGNQ